MTTTLAPLFRSELQLRMLGLLILNSQATWTAPQLAQRLDATSVSVHRELHRALDAGLLVREPLGRTYLYRAATSSPLYEPVRLLLERTVGIEVELSRALADIPGVEAAFLHGSLAKSTNARPASDIDVLVLGTADPHILRKRLRRLEKRLGREIDVLAYSPGEFETLARKGNSLIRGIIRGPVRTLVGSAEALQIQ